MSTNSYYSIPDVPIPADFTADAWQDDSPMPYRVLFGELRNTDGDASVLSTRYFVRSRWRSRLRTAQGSTVLERPILGRAWATRYEKMLRYVGAGAAGTVSAGYQYGAGACAVDLVVLPHRRSGVRGVSHRTDGPAETALSTQFTVFANLAALLVMVAFWPFLLGTALVCGVAGCGMF